jgi:hypothetical protein
MGLPGLAGAPAGEYLGLAGRYQCEPSRVDSPESRKLNTAAVGDGALPAENMSLCGQLNGSVAGQKLCLLRRALLSCRYLPKPRYRPVVVFGRKAKRENAVSGLIFPLWRRSRTSQKRQFILSK